MTDEVDVKIAVDSAGVKPGADAVKDSLKDIQEQIRSLKEGVSGFGEAFLEAFSVEKIAEFVMKMGELGEKTERAAAILGVSTQEVGKLNAIAVMTGQSSDGMALALERMQLKLAQVKDASSPAGAALKALGLTAKDLIGLPIPQQLDILANKFAQFADGGNKTAIAMALLGRGGAQMIPTLDEGAKGMEELAAVAERTGTALDEVTTKGLVATNREIKELGLAFQGAGVTVFNIFKPAIDGLILIFIDLVEGFNNALKSGGFLRDTFDLLAATVQVLVSAVAGVITAIQAMWAITTLAVDGMILTFIGLGKALYALAHLDFAGIKSAYTDTLADMKTRSGQFVTEVEGYGKTLVAELKKTWATVGSPLDSKKDKPQAPSPTPTNSDAVNAALKDLDGQIKVLQLGLQQKKVIFEGEANLYQITQDRKFQLLQQETQKEYEAEKALLEKELEIGGLKLAQRQVILNKIAELETKHTTDMIRLDNSAMQNSLKNYEEYFGALQNSFNSQLRGMLAGTVSFGQAMKHVFGDMIIMLIEQIEKWVFKWIAGQLAMTTATTTGAAARATAEATAGAAGSTVSFGETIAQIGRSAVQTFAGVFANLSPVMGPTAAAPAAASQAVVMASAAEVPPPLATGAWNIDRETVARLHPDELVAPAAIAPYVRDFLSGQNGAKSGGNSGDVHLHIAALDGASVKRLFMREGKGLMDAIHRQVRQGAKIAGAH